MHVPDGLLAPGVAATTGALAAAGLVVGLRRLEGQLRDRTTVLMGTMSAFVFAAQMVNFPVAPGVSGHLLGGVLAAVMLGPWAGAGVIGAVLIVQCLLFGDGGLTALGANFINMGLIGAVGGYTIYAPIRRAIGGRKGVLIGAMAAAWFSVILASGALAVELAASGQPFLTVLGWLALVHAAIGLGEALITGMVIRFILLTRPDLVFEPEPTALAGSRRLGQVAAAGLGIALAVCIFLAPLASKWPDGLDFVGERLRLSSGPETPVVTAPLAEYQVPGLGTHLKAATALAGVAGTLVVFAAGLGLARVFAGRGRGSVGGSGREGIAPDAA